MGALTDNRKRCFVDHRLPSSSHPLSELSLDTPPSKKVKFSAPTSTPDRMEPADHRPSPRPSGIVRHFPPVAPLPRPVHGPQRIIRAFGLGSAYSSRRSPSDSEMGNFVSEFLERRKTTSNSNSLWRWEKGKASVGPGWYQGSDDRSHEQLELEDYKRLVYEVEEGLTLETSIDLGVPPLPVVDLTAVTQKSEEPSELYALNRTVEDAPVVAAESRPIREERVRVDKVPLYKKLYEDSLRKHDSILSTLEFEVKLTKKKISGFRLAGELLQKKPKEDLLEPFAPLTNEDEDDVCRALTGGKRHEILVTHEPSNIEITREVLLCLSCGAWLNDEVINLYLELLKERERREPKEFLKCHFFNTFFYKKLISGSGYDFKAVRRWTTQRKLGYGLIECDKIFVPIHKEVHWCLAVINIKDKKFQYLDSLGGVDTKVLRVLARYLVDEVRDKSGQVIDMKSWKQEAVAELPAQKNGWDCGMFMLKYTDFYSRGLSLSFGQEHMEYFRKRTAKEILRLRAD